MGKGKGKLGKGEEKGGKRDEEVQNVEEKKWTFFFQNISRILLLGFVLVFDLFGGKPAVSNNDMCMHME